MSSDLAVIPQMEFTPDQVELIKRTVAVGATDDELQLFMYVAKKTGLDPFTRQIYALKRWNKQANREVMAIQTGVDGYRVVADRTGKLAGIDDPTFDTETEAHPNKATVTVKKMVEGVVAEFTASARWKEYVPDAGKDFMWKKMPYLMLGKCAETLALRKAFPADLSGVYTTEEMAQADNAQQEASVTAEVERQKAAYTPTATRTTLVETLLPSANSVCDEYPAMIPPELDWSYQKTTGVLICRILEVHEKATSKKREYLVFKLNQAIENTVWASYWHKSQRSDLMAAVGKVCKFMVSMSKDGKFVNIDEVLEIDGKHIDKAPADESAEFKAQALASVLEFSAEELRELYTKWCKGSWDETLVKLQEEQERRAAMGEPANATF